MQDNPLLDLSGLPKFDAILPQHVEPAVDSILGSNREKINHLIETVTEPGWDNFMAPLEALDELTSTLSSFGWAIDQAYATVQLADSSAFDQKQLARFTPGLRTTSTLHSLRVPKKGSLDDLH